MNDISQVSFEYLVIIALLVLISALLLVVMRNYFTVSGSVRQTGKQMSQKATGMLEGLR